MVWGYPVSFRDSPLGGGGESWKSMPEYFKDSGWLTAGAGKTYHSGSPPQFDAPRSWTEPSVGGSKPFAYLPPRYGPSRAGP